MTIQEYVTRSFQCCLLQRALWSELTKQRSDVFELMLVCKYWLNNYFDISILLINQGQLGRCHRSPFPQYPVTHSSCCFLVPSSQFRDRQPLTQIKATISSCLMAFSYSLLLFPSGKKSHSSVVNTGYCLRGSLDLAYLPWSYHQDPRPPPPPPASSGEGHCTDMGAAKILQSVRECSLVVSNCTRTSFFL